MNHRNSFLIAALVVLTTWGVSVQPAQARTVDKLKVSEGYDDRNTITSPIFDGTDLPPLSIGEFTESFDREARMFQRRKGMMRGGLNSKLGPKVQPAEIFAELLRTEAGKMGCRSVTAAGYYRETYARSCWRTTYPPPGRWV